MKLLIDLFSGLGGASAAFDESPHWQTLKFDNNEELLEHNRGLHIIDVADTDEIIRLIRIHIRTQYQVFGVVFDQVVIWSSPPCNEFSWANPVRHNREDFDFTLVEATLDIINTIQPDYWIMENVLGAVPVFEQEFGIFPGQKIGPVILWGRFPLIPISERDNWQHRKLDSKGSRSLRPNYRAKIPMAISKGLLDVLDNQRTLDFYSDE